MWWRVRRKRCLEPISQTLTSKDISRVTKPRETSYRGAVQVCTHGELSRGCFVKRPTALLAAHGYVIAIEFTAHTRMNKCAMDPSLGCEELALHRSGCGQCGDDFGGKRQARCIALLQCFAMRRGAPRGGETCDERYQTYSDYRRLRLRPSLALLKNPPAGLPGKPIRSARFVKKEVFPKRKRPRIVRRSQGSSSSDKARSPPRLYPSPAA